jgi:uncharacterized protein YjbI with pentapeptide repeats
MADTEHIKLLCGGVATWNKARQAAPLAPDLSHVEVRDAILRGVDLRAVEFDGARLFNADIRNGLLVGARLNGLRADTVDFEAADLARVELKGADFTRCSFRNADLSGVVTFDLKFRHCDLSGARLSCAKLEGAHVYNSDMTGVVLDRSDLGAASFKRVRLESETESLLKELGARTALVNQVRETEWIDWDVFAANWDGAVFGRILFKNQVYWIGEGRWDFFISHASVDKDKVVRPLADALRALGQRVWYDEFTVRLGDDLSRVIEYGTRSSLFGVIVISSAFFGRRWTEAEFAALKSKRVFVVRHGVSIEELVDLRAELADHLTISADEGPARIADALVAAIRAPRPEDQ